MINMKRFVFFCCFIIVGCGPSMDGVILYESFPEEVELAHDREALDSMTLEEKIGQLLLVGMSGKEVNAEVEELITDLHVGGFIMFAHNLESAEQTVHLLNDLKRVNENNPYPLFLSVDQEGGRVTRLPELETLPTNWEIGKKGNLAKDYGKLIGEQVAAFGFNMNFAPVLDVNNEPNNPVIGDRAFGDNVQIVQENGIDMFQAIQKTNVIPVGKHFPGHGDVTVDSHEDIPVIDKSLSVLEEMELAPFRAAIEEGIDVVMVGHLFVPQIDEKFPASMSREIIQNVLRESFAFDGVVITDDMTMGAITNTYNIEEIAPQIIHAGADMLLIADEKEVIEEVAAALKASVASGELSEERVDESVMRIIQLKEKYNVSNMDTKEIHIEALNDAIVEFKEKLIE